MEPEQSYDQWAATYDEVENVTRDMDAQVTKKILSQYTFGRVLELGCGTGKNTTWLTTVADQVTCVDFSNNMLARAKEKLYSDKASFHQADITKPLDFLSTKVDLVTCNLTMEHIEDINPVFENASAALTNNGLFFFSEYHPFRQYLGKQARFEIEGETIYVNAFLHHVSEYLSAAKRFGFTLLECEEWFDEDIENGAPRLLTGVFRKN